MLTVSVIIPSFNQGSYIQQTIDSILSQDFRDLECLVVDGGSTDETPAILAANSDPRLSWTSEHDRGQAHAINKGLSRAQGRYLTYLNSDDLLKPGAVAEAVAYLEAHPEADLIEGDLEFINADGQPLGLLCGRPFALPDLLAGRHRFNQAGAFWRRSLTERIGLMDESLHYCMDHDYWTRAALAGANIVYVPGVRAAFRLHSGSKTVAQTDGFLKDWETLNQRLQAAHADDPVFLRMLDQSRTASAWRNAVHFWREGQLVHVRPQLRRVITRHPSPFRRGFASLLLLDSYLHSNVAGFALQRLGRFAPQPEHIMPHP